MGNFAAIQPLLSFVFVFWRGANDSLFFRAVLPSVWPLSIPSETPPLPPTPCENPLHEIRVLADSFGEGHSPRSALTGIWTRDGLAGASLRTACLWAEV